MCVGAYVRTYFSLVWLGCCVRAIYIYMGWVVVLVRRVSDSDAH